jgi:hypothetical protein
MGRANHTTNRKQGKDNNKKQQIPNGPEAKEQKWKLYRRQLEAALVVCQRTSGFISILSGLKNNFKGFKKH